MTTRLERDVGPTRACLPDGADALFLMYAVLMRAGGGDTTAPDVHDAGSSWTIGIGPDTSRLGRSPSWTRTPAVTTAAEQRKR